jgi:peptide subunit release factor 1 (eRF1)
MEEIRFPSDFAERAERAVEQAKKYGAACFWCGYGYDEYSRKSEAENIAYHCPEAPEELKENMTSAISGEHVACADKKATNKRRCRRNRL